MLLCYLVADLLEPGRRPVRSWSKPNSITLSWSQTGSKMVADKSRTGQVAVSRMPPVVVLVVLIT